MPQADPIQTNFTSGEISPLMYGRVDIQKYFNGVKRLQNMIVRPQGSIWRRGGTRFVNVTKDNAKKSIVKEFIYSSEQAYILEFGHLYVRVYRNHGVVESAPGVPVEVVTPYTQDDLANLQFAQSADVLWITCYGHQTRKLTRTSHTSWVLSLYSPSNGPYLDEGDNSIVLFVSAETDQAQLVFNGAVFSGAGDVGKFIEFKDAGLWRLAKVTGYIDASNAYVDIYDDLVVDALANSQVMIKIEDSKLVSDAVGAFKPTDVGKYCRTFDGVWKLVSEYIRSDKLNYATGPTMIAYNQDTLIPTFKNRVVTSTIKATSALFASTDVNRWLRLRFGASWTDYKITAFTSSTEVTATSEYTMPRDEQKTGTIKYQNGRADGWKLGAWNSVTGWPETVTFHEQRIVFGRTKTQPQTLWMSRSADYEDMAPTDRTGAVLADSAINYTIASNRANPICWLETGPVLLIGTTNGEFQCRASSINEPITPTNIDVKEQTRFGGSPTRAFRVGAATLFLQRGGKKIREMTYDFNIDAFVSKDLSIISEHILRISKGVSLSFQQEPAGVLWVNLADGTLAGMTYERDQEVIAWHRHTLADSGFVESIAVIPEQDGGFDNLYMVVRRTVGGNTVRYIERMMAEYSSDSGESANNQYYVDCGLSYAGPPATVFSGLDHLAGKTVQVFADGAYIGTKVVSLIGEVTLDTAKSTVHIGLGYTSTLITLDPEGGSATGTSQGKTKRIHKITFRIKDSYPFYHGESESSLILADEFSGMYSGDIAISLNQGYGLSAGYVVQQTQPVALNIIALMPQFLTNE